MQTIHVNEKVVLTAYRPEDEPDLVSWLNDEEIYRNTLAIPYPYTEEDARHWLALASRIDDENDACINWAVRNRSGRLIGGIGRLLVSGKDSHADEIGYWLARPYRNRGVMSLVVRAFCDYWFEQGILVRISAVVFNHNLASARVLEKAGFEREGYLRKAYCKEGQYLDGLLYGRVI